MTERTEQELALDAWHRVGAIPQRKTSAARRSERARAFLQEVLRVRNYGRDDVFWPAVAQAILIEHVADYVPAEDL